MKPWLLLKGKEGVLTHGPIAVLLPHEVLPVLHSIGQTDCLLARGGSRERHHMHQACHSHKHPHPALFLVLTAAGVVL